MRGLSAVPGAWTAWLGWAAVLLSVTLGWALYGWPGVVLALTVTVFWLLLQFSRAVRVMRTAAGRPVGHVDSAVMLHARLRVGLTLAQIIPLTRSLGEKRSDTPETFAWRDGGGDEVLLELQAGRLLRWTLQRAAAGAGADPPNRQPDPPA